MVRNLDPNRKRIFLFQGGLLLFSVAPSIGAFLILLVLNAGSSTAVLASLLVLTGFQLAGLLFEKGIVRHPLLLRISYWSLKMLQSVFRMEQHLPEKMVVGMNNRKVIRRVHEDFRREETLILAPHCLQHHECTHRLTFDPDSCVRCGRCPIGEILSIRDRFGVRFAIASGGTSARRIVEGLKPRLIIAVACPVDLSLGILDVHPVTTVGVLNEWRNGPCIDTWVNPADLQAALELFLNGNMED